MPTAIGLLSGVGSLLREAQDAGFTLLGQLETRGPYRTGRHLSWDLNFPNFAYDHVPFTRHPGIGIDLAIGHPPCGNFSHLGNSGQRQEFTTAVRVAMQARRQKDPGLIPLFIQQTTLLKPRIFLLDNLPKMLETAMPEQAWREALPKYHLTFIKILNWDYGTPQLRKRLWIVGVRKPGKRFEFVPPKKRLPGPRTVLEAFKGLSWKPWENDEKIGHVHIGPFNMLTGDYRSTVAGLDIKQASQLALGFLALPPGCAWPYVNHSGRLVRKIGRVRATHDKYARTITGLPSLHHPLTGWPLTARERARLMNWPDDFKLGDENTTWDKSSLMRLTLFTGKAVPSGFPRYILPQLLKHLKR